MMDNKIEFVEKYENQANLPECRPIENFWSIIKSRVYKDGWKAKNSKVLEARIVNCIKKVQESELAALFETLLPNLRRVGRKGVIEKQ